jgi:sigma-B regulation protein RsbU (phosphoserine phosphatase)
MRQREVRDKVLVRKDIMSETENAGLPGLLGRLSDNVFGARGGSLSKKLLRAFLVMSACGMIAVIVVTELMFQSILGVTEQSNRDIGETAAQSSESALTDTVLADTEMLVQAKSDIISESLASLAGDLVTAAGYVEGLYVHPDDYRAVPFEHLKNVPADTLALQWALSPGMVSVSRFDARDLEEAGVLDETYLLGNIEHMGRALMLEEPAISSLYLTTGSGVNIGYDSFAEQKQSVDTINLRERDWYLGAVQNDGLYISDTYRDAFDRGLNITMSMPVKGPDGSLMGVTGIDINISDLETIVSEINAGSGGYAVLLNGARIISAPGLDEGNEDDLGFFLGDEAQNLIERMRADTSSSEETTIGGAKADDDDRGQTGVGTRSDEPQEYFAVWSPVEMTGWHLVILVPKADILAPSANLHFAISTMTDEAAASASSRIMLANLILVAVAALLVAVSVITSRSVSMRIARPLTKLNADVDKVATGDLDYHSDINTGDEIEELSHSFEDMTRQLKDYIAELNLATAERERISTELNVAAHIQASMLPNTFPAFPDSDEFDIFATMDTAKEIGGDFYDFFFISGGQGGGRLAVVIADVSDKGIPAALFMVVARTLIKSNAQMGLSPSEVFEAVNDLLVEGNDANMFVTAFMGYLDLESGLFTYVNAGHMPTLVSGSGKRFEKLEMNPGFVLGALPGLMFEERQTTLAVGDRLFLYTDGVTEATSPSLELFSEERLLVVLDEEDAGASGGSGGAGESGHITSVAELLTRVKRDMDTFVAGSEQADDITMLALELKRLAGDGAASDKITSAKTGAGTPLGKVSDTGNTSDAAADADAAIATSEIRVDARIEKLPEVLNFIETAFEGYGFSDGQIRKVAVVAEEVFVNIAHYAYAEGVAQSDGSAAISVYFDSDTKVASLRFADSGVAFNPLLRPDPDVTLDASERKIGGLGIYMVRTMMDSAEYDYQDGHNILTVKLALTPAPLRPSP